ncbi:MAG: carboxypeptidase-like regulatory domain-containing protein [Tannerella sp.]|jgi:TonB-dependent SusC/RagA subfamily outer membrane receptor|nr:carboxypeptidase-like regulatory domain-containing protein [Tannerella sp.]
MKTGIFSFRRYAGLLVSAVLSVGISHAQSVIRGQVIDKETKEPLAGANIVIKPAGNGTVSDASGDFSLESKSGKNVKLAVSYVGYKVQEVAVNDFSKPLVFEMITETAELNDVVIVGYGTSTRDKLTGSISTVHGEVIGQAAITNILESLQGRVAGMTIDTQSGIPGAETTIQIRGLNTFTKSNGSGCCMNKELTYAEPLILVDGVPIHSKSVNALGLGAVGDINPLSALNPADVERLEILKDADATAIYGSRGSNGVILITTKKGI